MCVLNLFPVLGSSGGVLCRTLSFCKEWNNWLAERHSSKEIVSTELHYFVTYFCHGVCLHLTSVVLLSAVVIFIHIIVMFYLVLLLY
jgi:hypothetical protein